ncbi:methyltransferase domain-containing protein [Phaeovulum vinaykumarii]|uniref:Trans-aconitate 2-methyltransferase n=1 Tax=Phaeovulum vinaykumarii TaxID=407234 RepID=A0A1N7K3R0_9RHOB|nr:methyltransferase domain-containing protein [Phaeovulum vinaykumarii]SIS56201.1 trans-aconitate 2-methyltransferase [Phaeovulum vinaykumarii]SOB92757.1 trans-aconitate 2-methyltransferase [Phaeovulum vinaykumarii]
MADWNPESYARFGGLRLRPALDLLAQVHLTAQGDVIDLGCGNGLVAGALRARAQGRRLIGVDTSPAMLKAASGTAAYSRLVQADARAWMPERPPAMIFSNALVHWLDDHETLLRRLAGFLAPGGILAVQMPRQHGAPSHRFLRDFAAEMFPDRFDFTDWEPPVAAPAEYHRMLAPLGLPDVWQTDYVQRLGKVKHGHPVRRFTEPTAMRPFLEQLTEDEAGAYIARYDAALAAAYPLAEDGSVLFPFRRVFFTLTVPG